MFPITPNFILANEIRNIYANFKVDFTSCINSYFCHIANQSVQKVSKLEGKMLEIAPTCKKKAST